MARHDIAPLLDDPARTGLFLDFDGTLSEIVHVPNDARPLEGTADILQTLAQAFGVVAVVSGRGADQLLEWLGPGIEIWGVHGASRVDSGDVVFSDRAEPHVEPMRRVLEAARREVEAAGVEGALIEDKGVILNLHFRAARDPGRAEAELGEIADRLADRFGLTVVHGRMSYELRAPIEFSKALVVLERSEDLDLTAVAFFGDDRVDLPAFDALDELAERGLTAVRIAVHSDEAPEELLKRADIVVEGPAGALELLKELAGNGGNG